MPWSEPGLLAACAVGALGLSAGGTAWAAAYARRRGMLDQPGERRSHATATPRGGGIGIVLAMVCALALLGWCDAPSWWAMAAGLLPVAGVGWWDDHRPLPITVRLGAHAGAALALAWCLHVQGAGLPAVMAALVLVPCLVNAWNFMDGIDGLAASQALICAIGLACLLAAGPWQLLCVALAAACLGFLPFNLPPARIFLGDVGSGALGYLMAAMLAGSMATLPTATWPLLALPPMAMLGDSGLTLGWRVATGQRWWQPHVQHLFQHCSRHWGHARVTTAYAVWTCVAIGIMLCAQGIPMPGTLLITAIMALVWLLAWARIHPRGATTTEGLGR